MWGFKATPLLPALLIAELSTSTSAYFCFPSVVCPAVSSTDVPSSAAWALQKRASLQDSLFPPLFNYSNGFTTASGVSLSGIQTTELQDSALNIVKVQSGMSHNVVQQEGKDAWEANYPQGSFNPSHQPLGGFGFYVGGSSSFYSAISSGAATDILLSYSLMFQSGWAWNMGGKLPGAFGGTGDNAFGCSGGRQEGRDACFGARLMWRADGKGELYTYLPLTESNKAAQVKVPGTVTNDDYGFSVGRGAFTWPAGEWVTVAERIKLSNSSSSNDGIIQVFINGEQVIDLEGVSIPGPIQGFQFQTFFGGSTSDYASPQSQKAWFADVSGAVVSDGGTSGGNGTTGTMAGTSSATRSSTGSASMV